MSELSEIIKEIAVGGVNAGNPANIAYGTVVSASPLRIQIDQKTTLEASQLVLCRGVTNHTINVSINWATGGQSASHHHSFNVTSETGGTAEPHVHTVDGHTGDESADHTHQLSGTKAMTVLAALSAGEKVIMMQLAGAQQYVVIDRVG